MRTGIHFHGKLRGAVQYVEDESDVLTLDIQVSQKAIELLRHLDVIGTPSVIMVNNIEIEVTIAYD